MVVDAGLGRRAQKKLERRAAILNCAAPLFERHGFDGVSVEALAEGADVSLRTLYNFFPSKLDILVAVHAQLIQQRLGRALKRLGSPPDSPVDGLCQLVEAHFRIFDALDRDLLVRSALHGVAQGPDRGGGRDYAMLDALSLASFRQLLETYASRGALGPEPDVESLARLVFAAANGEFFIWLADRQQPVEAVLGHMRDHIELALPRPPKSRR